LGPDGDQYSSFPSILGFQLKSIFSCRSGIKRFQLQFRALCDIEKWFFFYISIGWGSHYASNV